MFPSAVIGVELPALGVSELLLIVLCCVSGDERMAARRHWFRFVCGAALVTVTIGSAARSAGPPAAPTSGTSTEGPPLAAHGPPNGRFLYAVNQAAATRGSISVYDIGAGHRLVKTIETVRDADDVKGVAASAATAGSTWPTAPAPAAG